MELTHIDELPVLEHNREVIYVTSQEYDRMSEMNSAQVKRFLHEDLRSRISDSRDERILRKWLMDPTIDWKQFQARESCPIHLRTVDQNHVNEITCSNGECVTKLPNLGEGKNILVQKALFKEILRFWSEGRIALLDFGLSRVRQDGVLVPSTASIRELEVNS